MRYLDLVEVYEKLSQASKRLEKTFYIAELLKRTDAKDIPEVMLLIQGRVFPPWEDKKIGVAAKLVLRAINLSTGIEPARVEKEWKKTGDLGLVAQNLIKVKKQATLFNKQLSVKQVLANLKKLADLEGAGSVDQKIQLISELLTSAEPLEAKYIIRTVLEELRVGVGEGSVRDAIVWAYLAKEAAVIYNNRDALEVVDDKNREKYSRAVEAVQHAYNLTNDFAKVCQMVREKGLEGLERLELEPGIPIKVMLFQKAKDIHDAFERVGKPAALEYKYDGFRMQVHKSGREIRIFTRRLENVTKQFPEVVGFVRDFVKGDNFILDSEAVGFAPKTGKYLPFQSISQRIRRKYDIDRMAKDFPVELNVFDIVYYNDKTTISLPFAERRKLIEKIIKEQKKKIILAKQIITSDENEAGKFYEESLANGEEGIMVKSLQGAYTPGKRVGYGVKVKPVMESLDLVIVAAKWGEGKRAAWLTSFTIACIDEDDQLLEIGKVGTGIKELETEGEVTFPKLTEMLKPLIIAEKGKSVKIKPSVVIEVEYEEIQKSPTYLSGFALRFPRVVRLRDERGVSDASTLEQVKDLFKAQ